MPITAVMRNRRNFYRVLQVQPDAPYEIIKASYRTLMQKLKAHPDLGGDEWNAALINEAYAVLSDPEKRANYDAEQMELRQTVGAGSRAGPGPPTPEPETETAPRDPEPEDNVPVDLDSPPPPDLQSRDPHVCAFCRTRNAAGDYRIPDEICRGCGAPMRPLEVGQASKREREARRIDHQGVIHFRVDASRPGAYAANVVDLSPTGLRFVSRHRLRKGCVVKLDSPTLSAVASVTHSTASTARDQFSTGVKFLTLKLTRPRGTFVYARA